jgi:hypothetical protein
MLIQNLIIILPFLVAIIPAMLLGMFIGRRTTAFVYKGDIADMERNYQESIQQYRFGYEKWHNEVLKRQKDAYTKRHTATVKMLAEATAVAQSWRDDCNAAINQRNELLEQLTDLQNSFRRDNADTITVGLN